MMNRVSTYSRLLKLLSDGQWRGARSSGGT
jgi:hypothetical protein